MDASRLASCLRRVLVEEPPGSYDAAVNVVIALCPDPRVVMVERTRDPRDPWSGDMAFPGGRREESEGPLDTALRETLEEACIGPEELEVLGFLEPVSPRNVPLTVVPVVTLYRAGCPALRGCRSSEVQRVALVPVAVRLSVEEVMHPGRGFRVDGYRDWYGNIVWGMSLRVLRALHPRLWRCLAEAGWPPALLAGWGSASREE